MRARQCRASLRPPEASHEAKERACWREWREASTWRKSRRCSLSLQSSALELHSSRTLQGGAIGSGDEEEEGREQCERKRGISA